MEPQPISSHHRPATLTAIDQSEGFVKIAQKRLGTGARCRVGNALALQLEDSSVDISVSGLVLNFIPETEKALSEMRRVTGTGGTVAVYVWDYAGKMDFLKYFWDAAVELKPEALSLHESRRFHDCNAAALDRLFKSIGLADIETSAIEIDTHFKDFNDYWVPFLGGQGPAPSFVMSLDEAERKELRNTLQTQLPFGADGTISMTARAIAAKGRIPIR